MISGRFSVKWSMLIGRKNERRKESVESAASTSPVVSRPDEQTEWTEQTLRTHLPDPGLCFSTPHLIYFPRTIT